MSRTKDLEAQVQRLQRALAFWLPGMPLNGGEVFDRAAADAYLLIGYNGPTELSAEELGWITLNENPDPPTQQGTLPL